MKKVELSGLRIYELENGHVQVYAKQKSRQLAAQGIKHSAWRLAFEISPKLIDTLHAFIQPT